MEIKEMNLYQKIAMVRNELSTKEIKKSGFQSFAKFNYFTLQDILPPINELEKQYGLFTYVECDDVVATITVINTDNLNEIPFVLSLVSGETNMKGQQVMNGAATRTYMTRSCYMGLYNISESEDMVDASIGKDEDKKPRAKKETVKADEDLKTKMKSLCTSKSGEGKKDMVLNVLNDVAGVKNPNAITDETMIKKIIDELNKL